MGIQLDWRIESDSGWQDVDEDPLERARRRKRSRRLRRLLAVSLGVLILGGGAVTLRLRQAARQRAFALESTFAAETAALRVGDRDAFLKLQLENDAWRALQAKRFDEYVSLGSRVVITGDILRQEIDADRARVTARELLDGQPYIVRWHYEYTAEGWRHVPPIEEFWGEPLASPPGPLRFVYYEADQTTVAALQEATRGWLCRCNLPPIEIRLTLDPGVHPGFSPTEPNVLLIPSPLQGRVAEDGGVDPALLSTIADALAGHYARARTDTLPTQIGTWEREWRRAELYAYLRHRYDPDAPPSIYLDPLIASSDIFARSSYTVLLASINDTNPDDFQAAWRSYLSALLNAEADYRATGQDVSVMRYVESPLSAPSPIIDPGVEFLAQPGSIEVVDVERRGDLVWAEVRFQAKNGLRGSQAPNFAFEPFETWQGWLYHTQALAEDWGDVRERRADDIILRYHELDEPYVDRLMTTLQNAYVDYLNELSVSIKPPVALVSFSPFYDGVMYTPQEIESMQPAVWFVLRSPYVLVRGKVDTPASQLEANAVWKLRENIYEYVTWAASGGFGTP